MVIKYNVTGADRKRLVTTLSKITGVKAKYLGMPSMAYEVGDLSSTRMEHLNKVARQIAKKSKVWPL